MASNATAAGSTVEPTIAPTVTPLATPGSATQLAGQALVEALRAGGYIIFLRHTATDQSQGDSDDLQLLDCSKQRNLNDQGRADAEALGVAIRALQIPIGHVLSSKYCRTLETTRLAFGETFTPTDDITGFNLAPDSQERRRRNAALRDLLSTPPAPGTNLVLVSHQFNLGDVTGLESKEGDTLVFAPSGPAGFTLVARIPIGAWAELRKLAQ